MLIQDGAHNIDQFGPLVEEPLTCTKNNGSCLLFFGFRLHKAHFWSLCSNDDRFRIRRIVFLPLNKWLNILRCNKFNIMTQSHHFS